MEINQKKKGAVTMDKKNTELRIRCSSRDKERIKREANKTGLSLSKYCLQILKNTEVSIKIQSR